MASGEKEKKVDPDIALIEGAIDASIPVEFNLTIPRAILNNAAPPIYSFLLSTDSEIHMMRCLINYSRDLYANTTPTVTLSVYPHKLKFNFRILPIMAFKFAKADGMGTNKLLSFGGSRQRSRGNTPGGTRKPGSAEDTPGSRSGGNYKPKTRILVQCGGQYGVLPINEHNEAITRLRSMVGEAYEKRLDWLEKRADSQKLSVEDGGEASEEEEEEPKHRNRVDPNREMESESEDEFFESSDESSEEEGNRGELRRRAFVGTASDSKDDSETSGSSRKSLINKVDAAVSAIEATHKQNEREQRDKNKSRRKEREEEDIKSIKSMLTMSSQGEGVEFDEHSIVSVASMTSVGTLGAVSETKEGGDSTGGNASTSTNGVVSLVNMLAANGSDDDSIGSAGGLSIDENVGTGVTNKDGNASVCDEKGGKNLSKNASPSHRIAGASPARIIAPSSPSSASKQGPLGFTNTNEYEDDNKAEANIYHDNENADTIQSEAWQRGETLYVNNLFCIYSL